MSRKTAFVLLLLSAVSCGAAVAATTSTVPVAYVYVASNYGGAGNDIVGYAAAANGQLSLVPGSPFYDNVASMAVNGKYLFGSDNVPNSGRNIYSYLIESNGSLKYLGATDIQLSPGDNCSIPGPVVLDHTGADLYAYTVDDGCHEQQAIQSLHVNNDTGLLQHLFTADPPPFLENMRYPYPLAIAADNIHAYFTDCNPDTSQELIFGFARQTDGSLMDIKIGATFPAGGPSGNYRQCVNLMSADPTNHLAVDVQYNASSGVTPDQIATYAIDTSNGDLSTNSTYSNMPATAVYSVTAMRMAPSGKLLAVGGQKGLQVFNFNPAGQATPLTGLLTTDSIDATYWDNSNHLYAISNYYGELFVFTVTPTSAAPAPGSPYHIRLPQTMIVQPR